MPICDRGQLDTGGENEALTPGPCQFEGVTKGLNGLFSLAVHTVSALLGGMWRERECKPPLHVVPPA